MGLLIAEERWHLAIREFSSIQRAVMASDIDTSTDVLTQLHDVAAVVYGNDNLLDETEVKLADTHTMLAALVDEAESKAADPL